MTENFHLSIIFFVASALSICVAYFSTHGLSRLMHGGFWLIVLSATLPPLAMAFWSYFRSENPALAFAMLGLVAMASFFIAFHIGLFVPANWAWWQNLLVGLIPWSLVALYFIITE